MPGTAPIRIKTISEFHRYRGLPQPDHPLISVINFDQIPPSTKENKESWILDFYSIAIKKGLSGKVKYGQQSYDFDAGVMFFISPNQVFGIEREQPASPLSGWMLLIHPDFLWNTALAKNIRQYEFFDYAVNEALFLSPKEESIINGLMESIQYEYLSTIDKFSQNIIVSQIETLLNYAQRFHQRQFITRKISSHQILEKLETTLEQYINSSELTTKGLPSVQHIADSLHISPGYLSSLLKTLTGRSTQQHIHDKLIEKAKEKLSTTQLTVSEIAYELGFEHSQSFSKLFKSKTNFSPLEFRQSFIK
ncbi:helix-turn-helix domain-containing protein [Chryseobacterium sp. CT-SW4]|uniref:helix-turn-helix domain-containing protein n=1 Tax=Chryseobacterium sp. SW-1 TaxID=3157343 RepID=UPI003B025450